MRLREKVAIVTGAASGIGRAIALAMGGEGARVAALDLDGAGAASVAGASSPTTSIRLGTSSSGKSAP